MLIVIVQSSGTFTSLLCYQRRRKLVILIGFNVNHFFSLVANVLIVLLSSIAHLNMSTVCAQDPTSLCTFLNLSSTVCNGNSNEWNTCGYFSMRELHNLWSCSFLKIKMFTWQSLMDLTVEKENILPAQKRAHKVLCNGNSPNRRKKDIQWRSWKCAVINGKNVE